ncbi:hypothetical protein CXG81DRAFT_23364 [Caulochytrium protostelioides]|uniref:ABC transporter domain-containing protein n=1 Tax=Caulochytrium protostelioides TaxID=1555241 RepID=A0A4P9XFF6_9FUNG|nr:hypothetical protein CXG81DRAFT_23364 [Caulochytrium protostelioides]|eukprot:RKP03951.1 hypothetical protein CXG81DRAFT_23364 [Caulochytrium protostelioides]
MSREASIGSLFSANEHVLFSRHSILDVDESHVPGRGALSCASTKPLPAVPTMLGGRPFDPQFLFRLGRILAVIVPHYAAWAMLAGIFLANMLTEYLINRTGVTLPDFYLVLLARDTDGYARLITEVAVLYGVLGVARSAARFFGGLFAATLREALTLDLQARYVSPGVLYMVAGVAHHHEVDPGAAPAHPTPAGSAPPAAKTAGDDSSVSGSRASKTTLAMAPAAPRAMPLPEAEMPLLGSKSEIPSPAPEFPLVIPFGSREKPGNAIDDDNPDQRITHDVGQFCTVVREIVEKVAVTPGVMAYYSYQMAEVGAVGPSAIWSFFAFAAIVCRFVIMPVVPLVYHKERAEGNFRYEHVHLRTFSEQITFLHGEGRERSRLAVSLAAVLWATRRILAWELLLRAITETVQISGGLVAYVAVGVAMLYQNRFASLEPAEMSVQIARTVFVSSYLVQRFGMLTALSDRMGELVGLTARIGRLMDACDAAAAQNVAEVMLPPDQPDDVLQVDHLSVHTPDAAARRLIHDLSLRLAAGETLVVLGEVGSGKTALLRALCGLWPPCGGAIRMVSRHHVRVVNTVGYWPDRVSLREQLAYPKPVEAFTTEQYRAALAAVSIAYLDGFLDTVLDWPRRLSGGEKQRVSLASCVLQRPKLAFLDDAMSSIQPGQRKPLLAALRRQGMALILIEHDPLPGIRQLVLKPDGAWECITPTEIDPLT